MHIKKSQEIAVMLLQNDNEKGYFTEEIDFEALWQEELRFNYSNVGSLFFYKAD